jgi:CAAX prenyl protease-like protein
MEPADNNRSTPRPMDVKPSANTSTGSVAEPRWPNPWLVFLLPFVVYLVVGSLEPAALPDDPPSPNWLGLEYRHYPLVYAAKLLLTLAAVAYVWRGYRQLPWKLSPLALVVGALGVAIWIGLAWLQRSLGWTFGLGQRAAFNPLEQMADTPGWAYAFLAIRFFGLAVLVPVIEEMFLRGFAMRYALDPDRWWQVPFGTVNAAAVVVGTALPVLLHPGEALAAVVWFSGVTWLMIRTRSIGNCIVAHATTNLLLGCYVVASGQWWLM